MEYETEKSSLTFYVSNNLNVENISLKNPRLLDKYIRRFIIEDNQDLVIEDIGFIKVTKKTKKEDNFDLAFSFTSNKENKEEDVQVNEQSVNITNNIVKNEMCIKNKDVIINNALALADKKLKLSLQEKWSNVSDYLTDKYYSPVIGKWTDVSLEVVGGSYVIF